MEDKLKYYLEIADNAFILSHRLAENSSHGPYLEEDLAVTNTALDLIGMAESIYNEAAKMTDEYPTGDDLAYRRSEDEYRNCLLVEQPNVDFAHIMVRQFFMDTFNYYFLVEAVNCNDAFLNAVANKSLKEVTYHIKRSSEWIIRFGQGTEESSKRAQAAINKLWRYTDELFVPSEASLALLKSNESVDLEKVKTNWVQKVNEIFYMAELRKPENNFQLYGGKTGTHSEYMGFILGDIQFLTNKYPEATW